MDDQKKNNSKEGQPEGAPEGVGKEVSKDTSEVDAKGSSEPDEGKTSEGDASKAAAKEKSGSDEKPAAAAKKAAVPPADEKAVAKKPPVKKPVKRPVRPKGPAYEDLEEDSLLDALKERFAEGIVSGQSFLDQAIYTVEMDSLYDVMLYLRDDPDCLFDYLVDLTALDYLGEDKRFCLVYQLYSHPTGSLIRVKSRLERDEFAPSVTSIWTTADWLEREVYDMFGIEFSGHPDLKRILLPDDWHGFPLRKDYDIKLQDQSWIRKHLRIRKVPG